jgi:hypothetical protein
MIVLFSILLFSKSDCVLALCCIYLPILRSFIYALSDTFCMSPMSRGFPLWFGFPGNLDHPFPPFPPQSPDD